jgi:hypothetical protein
MADPLDALEADMVALRSQIRDAIAAGELDRTPALRARLSRTERAWDALVDVGGSVVVAPALTSAAASSVRDRVHQVLTLLMMPASPKLVDQVCRGLWGVELGVATSLRRDEERSWRSAPGSRPFYVCPALHHATLKPVRALLTLSTWELEQRICSPVSPLTHRLVVASRVAEAIANLGATTTSQAELLTWLAADIPGALPGNGSAGLPDPRQVHDAAELALRNHTRHVGSDGLVRAEAALRASKTLTAAERLFGART